MIGTFLIALREGLEAALIVSIVLGYLRKTGQGQYARFAWAGVGAAVLVSLAVGIIIQAVGAELEGQAEQIFEGTLMLVAVGVLTWMIFWMRYQARTLKSSLESDIQAAIGKGSPRGLFAVSFLAVVREGIETAIFISAAAFTADAAGTIGGTILGLLVAVAIGYAIYASTVRLNLRLFFNVTSVLLLVFAAGLFAHGIHEFQEAGLLAEGSPVWDISHIISKDSTLGQFLGTLVGYTPNPTPLQIAAYIGYWLAALVGVRWFVDRRAARHAAGTPAQARA
jgi:high-affinity iron transporter